MKGEDKPKLLWQEWEPLMKKWIAENLGKGVDLSHHNDKISEIVEPSPDLILPLLRFQKEWLAWSLKQEETPNRGGILADEMGMGKTVQAISLVLKKRAIRGPELPSSSTTLPEIFPLIRSTLVICPLAVCKQWASEINLFTSEGSTRVLLYEGTDRKKRVYQFSDYDFVITAYTTLENDYRCFIPPKKSEQKKTSDSVVNTRKSGKKEQRHDYSILHSVQWDRIILDEAHCIKRSSSNTARAVFDLQSSYKWALSGTPILNSVKDLYSLVRFLQIRPWCYYLCRICNCRSIDYSAPKECPQCPHTFQHFFWWTKYISTPIDRHGNTGIGRDAMILLKHRILKRIMLRRTKEGRAADFVIPPKTVIERWQTLDNTEEGYYTLVYTKCLALHRKVEDGIPLNRIIFDYVFDLVLQLRKVANHPYLLMFSSAATKDKGNGKQCGLCGDPVEDLVVTSCAHVFCKSCLSTLPSSSCPSCSKSLTVDFIGTKQSKEKRSILSRIKIENFQSSTKIEALKAGLQIALHCWQQFTFSHITSPSKSTATDLPHAFLSTYLREEISDMLERDGSAKGIVFSEFSSFLDLIHYTLKMSEVSCVQVDGNTPQNARAPAIKKFKEDPCCRILLTTFKVGGVGLNLTVASNVFLMEPSWNPSVELQAQDRIHRIGQHKPTRIVRFLIKNTIEERILELQEEKKKLFEGTVGGSGSSKNLMKSRDSDLRFLLGF